jgi:hypothetical protein
VGDHLVVRRNAHRLSISVPFTCFPIRMFVFAFWITSDILLLREAFQNHGSPDLSEWRELSAINAISSIWIGLEPGSNGTSASEMQDPPPSLPSVRRWPKRLGVLHFPDVGLWSHDVFQHHWQYFLWMSVLGYYFSKHWPLNRDRNWGQSKSMHSGVTDHANRFFL